MCPHALQVFDERVKFGKRHMGVGILPVGFPTQLRLEGRVSRARTEALKRGLVDEKADLMHADVLLAASGLDDQVPQFTGLVVASTEFLELADRCSHPFPREAHIKASLHRVQK